MIDELRMVISLEEYCQDLSGVEGDGLGEGEVAFEGEERCWEDWPLQLQLRFEELAEQGWTRKRYGKPWEDQL